jgi:hypothetical protein
MLSHVGQVLYGDWWQTQLANALGLSDRQMRRWVGMEAHIPSPILGEVLPRLFDAKVQKLAQVLDVLIAWREGQPQ